jgi:hypothetical protein
MKKEEKLAYIAPEFSFLSYLPLFYYVNLHSMLKLPQPSIA